MTNFDAARFSDDTDFDLDDLLIRYWLNEATVDEHAIVDEWFAQKTGRRHASEQFHSAAKMGQLQQLPPDVTAERTVRILQQINIAGRPYTTGPTVGWFGVPARFSRAIAVSLVGLCLLGLAWKFDLIHTRSVTEQHSIYATGNGERATVTLPDGSIVLLNVASRLEVPSDFAHGNRIISLSGEAFFTAKHSEGSPFTVLTSLSSTRVLGTGFTVRQYPTDSLAIVSVREGKVSVGSTILTAGYEAELYRSGVQLSQLTKANRFAFAEGVLFIESRSLTDAIPDLNRWFNVDIRLADSSLESRRVTGSFEIGSITDLMWILETTYGVRATRNGRVVTLYPRGNAE